MARPAKAKTKVKVPKEVSAAVKQFKASSDIEKFYRFIHDNHLRSEANILVKTVLDVIAPKKKRKRTLQ